MATLTPAVPRSAPNGARKDAPFWWIDALLILILAMDLAGSLQAAKWTPGLERLFPVVFAAVITATTIALSGFGRWFALLYSLTTGAATVLFSIASLMPAELHGQERVYELLNRTSLWLASAFRGRPAADNLMFVLVLATLVWVLVYSATWTYLHERRKWQAVLPMGLAMLINLYYAPPRLGVYFVIYILCAILLVVRGALSEHEDEWLQEHVYFPADISFDFMRDGILFAIFVIFVAWILPANASEGKFDSLTAPLQEPWRQVQQEWNRLFSTLNYTRAGGAPTFGTTMGLGGPRHVNDELVADIQTPVNRYYRAVVFDAYLPGGWVLQNAPGRHIEPETGLSSWQGRREITQTVTTYVGGNVLLAASQVLRANMPIDARTLPEATIAEIEAPEIITPSRPIEMAMVVSRDVLHKGDSYEIVSAIPDITIAQLRADKTVTAESNPYPDYIRERYLQLPTTVPQRVLDLAEEVAKGQTNPYDIAKTIETFLRGYTYNDQIPGPQPGQDGVDYFLFEEKQGYCNYYASALVVMLRHLGIPARLASGYATGELIPQTGAYRIRNRDAHAWVEVYFPTYGWIEFEPTASEPALERPNGITSNTSGAAAASLTPLNNEGGRGDLNLPEEQPLGSDAPSVPPLVRLRQNSGLLLLLGAILGILGVVVWVARRLRQPLPGAERPLFRDVPQGFAARLWEKVLAWAQRFGLIAQPSQTPLEHAGAFGSLVPDAAAELTTIADFYTRHLYSPRPITTAEASDAQFAWLRLRPLLQRRWLERTLRAPAGLRRALFREG